MGGRSGVLLTEDMMWVPMDAAAAKVSCVRACLFIAVWASQLMVQGGMKQASLAQPKIRGEFHYKQPQ